MSRIEIGREQENGPNGRNFPGKWNNRGRSGGFSRENKPTGEASVKEERERMRERVRRRTGNPKKWEDVKRRYSIGGWTNKILARQRF